MATNPFPPRCTARCCGLLQQNKIASHDDLPTVTAWIEILLGSRLLLGSGRQCDAVFGLSYISEEHCEIKAAPEYSSRAANGSTNAPIIIKNLTSQILTSLNGQPLQKDVPYLLEKGDSVLLGSKEGAYIVFDFWAFDHKSYEFGPQLGQGSFGSVQVVRRRDNASLYAAKCCKVPFPSDYPTKMTISLEYRALKNSNLRHHAIVAMHAAYHEPGFVFFILEYAKYGSLSTYLLAFGVLDERRAAKVTKQILAGLNHLHMQKLIHCDIKPDNMLVFADKPLQVKICDLGFIRPHQFHVSWLGTRGYMAPEILNEQRWDAKVDSFSLGISVIAMMTGKLPYANGLGVEKIGEPDLYRKLPVEPSVVPEIEATTKECKDFLDRMLEEDPTKRISIAEANCDPWVLMFDM